MTDASGSTDEEFRRRQSAADKVLRDFAELLAHGYTADDALDRLIRGAREVLQIAGAGVSLAEGKRIKVAAAEPQRVLALEQVQEESQEGPCIEAYRSDRPVLVSDLAQDNRWPQLNSVASQVGIVAVAGIPIHLDGTRLGALNLYDERRRGWNEEEVAMATLLADTATAYVANASRLEALRETSGQLQEALDSRVIIEQAKGKLAGENGISMDEAFELLRSHARSNHCSLHSVAEAVVDEYLRL